jgi:integrase
MSAKTVLQKLTHPAKITLYKNGNNANVYYFTCKGRVCQGSTRTNDLDKAIDVAIDIYSKVKGGKTLRQQKSEHLKFSDVVEKFIQHKTSRVSNRTIEEYVRQSVYLDEYFAKLPIEHITAQDYDEYAKWRKSYYETHPYKEQQKYTRKRREVKGRYYDEVGDVSINRECGLLVSILRFARENLNAFQGKNVPSYKKRPEEPRDIILEKDEYLKLESYWKATKPYYWMIISFVTNTGIRYPSELNKIKWKDVHLDKSFVVIRDRKSKSGTLNTAVPLVGVAKKVIEDLKKRENVSKNKEDYVFIDSNGKQVKNIRKAFKKGLEVCGIAKDISMYSLRHLFTTRMENRSDIPLKTLATVLGHRDTTMLDKTYSHLRTSETVNIFKQSE